MPEEAPVTKATRRALESTMEGLPATDRLHAALPLLGEGARSHRTAGAS